MIAMTTNSSTSVKERTEVSPRKRSGQVGQQSAVSKGTDGGRKAGGGRREAEDRRPKTEDWRWEMGGGKAGALEFGRRVSGGAAVVAAHPRTTAKLRSA